MNREDTQARVDNIQHGLALRLDEIKLLQELANGKTNQQIADERGCSERTIESKRSLLIKASQTKTVAGLVAWAFRQRYIR